MNVFSIGLIGRINQPELQAAGKTPEELPQAMGEALKLEGDKLKYLLTALEVLGNKTNNLKRVSVFTLNEGEKAPAKAKVKEGVYFEVYYFPPLPNQGGSSRNKDFNQELKDKSPRNKNGKGDRDKNRRKKGRGPKGDKKDSQDQNQRNFRRGPRPPQGQRPTGVIIPVNASATKKTIIVPVTQQNQPTEPSQTAAPQTESNTNTTT